jgi:hypothetical protein
MPGDFALVRIPESAEVTGGMRRQRKRSAESGALSGVNALGERWQRAQLRFERATAGLLLSDAAEQWAS